MSANLPKNSPQPKTSPGALIPTTKIIELAKKEGVGFGPGNPEERIRYFIKLGILPHATRKTPSASISNLKFQISNSTTVGHLPYWVINRLIQVDRLKRSGKSYPEIAEKFKNIDQRHKKKTLKKVEDTERSRSVEDTERSRSVEDTEQATAVSLSNRRSAEDTERSRSVEDTDNR